MLGRETIEKCFEILGQKDRDGAEIVRQIIGIIHERIPIALREKRDGVRQERLAARAARAEGVSRREICEREKIKQEKIKTRAETFFLLFWTRSLVILAATNAGKQIAYRYSFWLRCLRYGKRGRRF